MNPVTKNKALISIIIFLLLTNIAMLIFFISLKDNKKSFHGNRDGNHISTVLEKEIGFSKQQMDEYQSLRNAHMEKVHPLFEGIRSAKDSFYNLLYTNPASDSAINKRAALIGEKQIDLDMQMFQHLKSVRNICTPEQLPKFDSAFKGIVARMTGRFRSGNDSSKNKNPEK